MSYARNHLGQRIRHPSPPITLGMSKHLIRSTTSRRSTAPHRSASPPESARSSSSPRTTPTSPTVPWAAAGQHLHRVHGAGLANGLAQAFMLGADFIGDEKVVLVLGDNAPMPLPPKASSRSATTTSSRSPATSTVTTRRVRDHRRQPDLPRTRTPAGQGPRPRRLARQWNLRLPGRSLRLRQYHRAPPGTKVGAPEELAWRQGPLTDDEPREQVNKILKSGAGRTHSGSSRTTEHERESCGQSPVGLRASTPIFVQISLSRH